MILQQLLFPDMEVCPREIMYYRGEGITPLTNERYCIVPNGVTLSTDTYFNSFSIGKWKKYTIINNLQLRLVLKGEFRLRIVHASTMNKHILRRAFVEQKIITAEKQEILVPFPLDEKNGIYYFELKSLSDGCEYWGGTYETEIDSNKISNIKLAIGICTFRRELHIQKNMKILRRTILENPKSPLYQKLEIYISDNGKSLSKDLETNQIHIFPNRNLGGSGGFTRSMIEIKKDQEKKGFTHILMMDDDVRLNPDAFLRTYTMLCLLKPEHRDAFIGGHMLKNDAQNIQSEAADHWDMVSHHPVKYNYNLENLNFIIKNEIEDSVNHFGWWYCCMPLNVVNEHNLPLPIFIKRDDIEYGLRNGTKFVTLNGICVWHEPFEYKSASYLEYYYFRNMCIMNSKHRLSFNEKILIKEVRKRIRIMLLRYRYKDAELSLLGIQHYLNGIDWLKKQDAEKLNNEIMKLGYKKEPIETLNFVFTHGVYEKNLVVKQGFKKKLLRALTLNGWLLPAKHRVLVPAYQPSTALFYRANTVLNYEEISNTGFFTKRDYSSLFYILKMYRQTVKMIHKKYKKVTLEYRNRYDELINARFWNNYLFTSGNVEKITSGLNKLKRPKNNKYQYREMFVSYIFRALQILLFWLPVKKKRVMIYVHDRKGFTCNPKYIVKKLVELYGEKLEIIWVSMHPETCTEVENLGITVIKSNTSTQMIKYLRTRFFITNDSFPSWALHRWNQKWMNTWHAGMNYKHIGYDYLAPMSSLATRIFKIKNRQPDFYLSGSDFFTKDTAQSFHLDEKVFLSTGLPRNDVLFEDSAVIKEKIRKYYNINKNKHIVIFAPTFRRGMKSDTFEMDFEQVRSALSERFGGEWIILFRNHNFVKNKQNYSGAINVSSYHDMQELMCAADVMISDYSSCMYDFCITEKPIFVYATDLDNYINNDRAFAYPLEKWPYPVARSNEELIHEIKFFDSQLFVEKVRKHLRDVGTHDNGTASSQVAEIIHKYCL